MNIKCFLNGQRPSFSRFFSSRLNVNQTLTAKINTDWRAIVNMRNQWLGLASPYVGFSYKAFQVGISYDVTTSTLSQASKKPSTWELSIIY